MQSAAEENEESDKKKRELAETRNEADSLVYAAEKLQSDLGDKMTAEEKGRLNTLADEVRNTLKEEDAAKIKDACEKLNKAVQEFSTRLYAASQQGEPDAAAGKAEETAKDAGAETVDAEFSDQ